MYQTIEKEITDNVLVDYILKENDKIISEIIFKQADTYMNESNKVSCCYDKKKYLKDIHDVILGKNDFPVLSENYDHTYFAFDLNNNVLSVSEALTEELSGYFLKNDYVMLNNFKVHTHNDNVSLLVELNEIPF